MVDLAQEGFSHEEVLQALQFQGGARHVRYELLLLRGETAVKPLRLHSFRLSCDYLAEVKFSGRFVLEEDPAIHWRSDRLQLAMVLSLGGKELYYPFPRLKAVRITGCGLITVEALDETVILTQSSLGDRIWIPKGTRYTDYLTGLLEGMGFAYVLITPSEAAFTTDREDWEPEVSLYALCSQLLAEIGYRGLEAARLGGIRSGPYEPPDASLAKISYRAGKESVLFPQRERELDNRCRPNRFIGYLSNPELPPMRAEYQNDNPASPTSPYNNGGYTITAVRRFDQIADRQSLEKNLRRWALETEALYEYIELQTAAMPHHEVREILALDCEGASGIYTEVGWTLERERMLHRLRRYWMD
ncbi:MAG: hypothetical protein HFG26_06250 [Provencibacterium sp.]|jgi:hypothetical protein|nr:hypothetical protein [Provencibacterium sp.]